VDLLNMDLSVEVRMALQGLLRKVGEVKLGLPETRAPTTPQSPTGSFYPFDSSRRVSRAL